MDLIVNIVVLIIGFVLGVFFILYSLREFLQEAIRQHEKENAPAEKKPAIRKLETETVNDMLYLYDKETRDFICQATSIEELATLSKQYKNVIAAVVAHNDKVFMFMDGKSKEFKL